MSSGDVRDVHPRRRDALIRQFVEVGRAALLDPSPAQALAGPHRRSGKLLFAGPSHALLDEFVSQVLATNDFADKFSAWVVSSRVIGLMALFREGRKSEEDASAAFSGFLNEIRDYSSEFRVVIPLAGLDIDGGEYRVGNVKLRCPKAGEIRALLPDIPAATAPFDQLVAAPAAAIEGKPCAEYSVVAENHRALERAMTEMSAALEILRYTIPLFYNSDKYLRIQQVSEVQSGARHILVHGPGVTALQYSDRGAPTPYLLSPARFQELEAAGLGALSAIVRSGRRTEVEERLLRAVHWLSEAQIQISPENQLLALITSLESVFTGSDRTPISATLAEGVAFTLDTTGEARRERFRRIRDLHGKRSRFSHGGGDIATQSDVDYLMQTSASLVQKLLGLRDRLSTSDDVRTFVEDLKFP